MSELSLKEAAAETRKFARMLKGMERLAEVAGALESADQAVADRRREEAQILARVAALKSECEEHSTGIAALRQEAAASVADAKTEASKIVEAAKAEANQILKDAKDAERDARANATKHAKSANAAMKAKADAEAALAEINERIAQAQEAARKIMGG